MLHERASLDELKAIETVIDARVQQLPILKLPIRLLLNQLSATVFHLLHGLQRNSTPEDQLKGGALLGRLSHLVPLLSKCPETPIGANARDVTDAYMEADSNGEQLRLLVSYAHLSELMPAVHRGYYAVSGDRTSGFELRHSTTKFENIESEDTLLSELALPFLTAPSPSFPQEMLQLANTAPTLDGGVQFPVLMKLYDHYSRALFELPLVAEAHFTNQFNVSYSELIRFRSAVVALSDFSIQLASALRDRQSRIGFSSTNQDAWNEMLEWMTLFWMENPMVGMLAAISGLDVDKTESLIDAFGIDFRTSPVDTKAIGDGYFPPFARLSGSIFLAPDVGRAFIQSRNLLYMLQRKAPSIFNKTVSDDLEPQLIRTTQHVLEPLNYVVKPNFIWSRGEIDLLVYDSTTNTAAHIQAKAPLPPQGARMVDRLESRLKEGIDQLDRVRSLDPSARDRLVSDAIQRRVTNVEILDVLLARSCFGTVKTREGQNNILLLSLPVLARTVGPMIASGRQCSLPELLKSCSHYSADLAEKADAKWIPRELLIDNIRIRIPTLDFDHSFINRERALAWRHFSALRIGTEPRSPKFENAPP